MFLLSTLPAILLLLGMFKCPESPRWLVKVTAVPAILLQFYESLIWSSCSPASYCKLAGIYYL